DPMTLRATAIAGLDGAPVWIARYDHGAKLAVVVAKKDGEMRVQRLDLAGHSLGATAIPRDRPFRPSSWFIDREDRLWYGVDAGEWGGMIGEGDLRSGRGMKVEGGTEPVVGFAAIGNALWAFGGVTHMGMTEGFIARVTGSTAQIVWRKGNFSKTTADPPGLPVVAAWETGAKIRVVVWREIYEVSPDLKAWKR